MFSPYASMELKIRRLVSALFRDMIMISVSGSPSFCRLCRAFTSGKAVPGFRISFSCSC